jgi:hypothetical protein
MFQNELNFRLYWLYDFKRFSFYILHLTFTLKIKPWIL